MALETIDSTAVVPSCAWTKRKRSRRSLPFHPRSEDEYLALCLVMLTRGQEAGCNKVSLGGGGPVSDEYNGGDSRISSPASLPREKRRPYKCSVCGRSFANGQALGGHKRSHSDRSGGKRAKGMAASVFETSGRGRGCGGFDLNLLPHLESEEEEMVVYIG